MQIEMMRLTLEIAAKTLFDADVGSETRAVFDAMQVLGEAGCFGGASQIWHFGPPLAAADHSRHEAWKWAV